MKKEQLYSHKTSGFTLIELSIVLIVIGLVVGGILVGRDMIDAAEDRQLMTQVRDIESGFLTFKTKHRYWPGDFPNATEYWGRNTTVCGTAPGDDSATGTCNGNGNGSAATGFGGSAEEFAEVLHLWSHLSHAGLLHDPIFDIEWQDAGEPINGVAQLGVEVPESAYGSTGFVSFDYKVISDLASGDEFFYHGTYGQILRLGRPNDSGWCPDCMNGQISSFRQAIVDTKYDDGMPGTGFIRANKGNSDASDGNLCTDSFLPTATRTANYSADDDDRLCVMIFVIGY